MPDDLIPFNRKENAFFTDLILLRNTMMSNADGVRDRLKKFPGAWRDLKLMEKIAEKICNNLSLTIPTDKLRRYQQLIRYGRYYMDFQGPIPKKDYKLLDTHDLTCLAEEAIKGKCSMCMADGREVKRCPLRNVLLTVAVPTEISRIGCEYRHVAVDLEAGREIKL